MTKVEIIKQVGQTGLRAVGQVLSVPDNIAKSGVKNKWAKDLTPKPKPRPKPKKSK